MREGEGGQTIWIYDLQRGSRQRVTGAGEFDTAIWSAAGDAVYYSGEAGVFSAPADRSAEAELVLLPEQGKRWRLWSVDRPGRRMSSSRWDLNRSSTELLVADLPSLEGAVSVVSNSGIVSAVYLSPDGRFLAYQSNESGEYQVYVREIDSGATVTVSIDRGESPRWSPVGDELFYLNDADNRNPILMLVPVSGDLDFGTPSELFSVPTSDQSWAVAPGAQRFLFLVQPELQSVGTSEIGRLEVVLGWFTELRTRVPVAH